MAGIGDYLIARGWQRQPGTEGQELQPWTRGRQQLLAPVDSEHPQFTKRVHNLINDLNHHEKDHRPEPRLQVWRDVRATFDWIGVGHTDMLAVHPDHVSNYLAEHGWRENPVEHPYRVFIRDESAPVRVPGLSLRDTEGYPDDIARALDAIATIEQRPTPRQQILADLETAAVSRTGPSSPHLPDLAVWSPLRLVAATISEHPDRDAAITEITRRRTLHSRPLVGRDTSAAYALLWQLWVPTMIGLRPGQRLHDEHVHDITNLAITAETDHPLAGQVQARLTGIAAAGFLRDGDALLGRLHALSDHVPQHSLGAALEPALRDLDASGTLARLIDEHGEIEPVHALHNGVLDPNSADTTPEPHLGTSLQTFATLPSVNGTTTVAERFAAATSAHTALGGRVQNSTGYRDRRIRIQIDAAGLRSQQYNILAYAFDLTPADTAVVVYPDGDTEPARDYIDLPESLAAIAADSNRSPQAVAHWGDIAIRFTSDTSSGEGSVYVQLARVRDGDSPKALETVHIQPSWLTDPDQHIHVASAIADALILARTRAVTARETADRLARYPGELAKSFEQAVLAPARITELKGQLAEAETWRAIVRTAARSGYAEEIDAWDTILPRLTDSGPRGSASDVVRWCGLDLRTYWVDTHPHVEITEADNPDSAVGVVPLTADQITSASPKPSITDSVLNALLFGEQHADTLVQRVQGAIDAEIAPHHADVAVSVTDRNNLLGNITERHPGDKQVRDYTSIGELGRPHNGVPPGDAPRQLRDRDSGTADGGLHPTTVTDPAPTPEDFARPEPVLRIPGNRSDKAESGSAALGPMFRPSSQAELAPSGKVSRLRANLSALNTLHAVREAQRPATADEQAVLARWSGWGALPWVFDDNKPEFDDARAHLRRLLTEAEIRAAARNTINAHYTDLVLVQRIWQAVGDLGFAGGTVLEPGCGSGNFLGQAPESAHLVGVEVEPTSADIARQLAPTAQILTESFADTHAPDSTFDLVIGNVPFGDIALTDRTHNRAGHSIHNHFIVKALHLTKPGGMVAVITSRYTLDAQKPGARREMAAMADLIGAVRLPSRAHQRAAGTEAVTDLLVLRRREPGRGPDDTAWEQSARMQVDDEQIRINEYFHDHPEMVLGELRSGTSHGMYRADDLAVVHPDLTRLDADFATALAVITAHAHDTGLLANPVGSGVLPAALVQTDTTRQEGTMTAHADGTFTRLESRQNVPLACPKNQRQELRALLGIRDTVVELLNTEAAHRDDVAEIDQLREQLNRRYDGYYRTYGAINRFTWRRTGRTDPETGDDVLARYSAPLGGFRLDAHAPTVMALEDFDSTTQEASKMDIFTSRVVAPREAKLEADSAADAIAICWDTHGRLVLDEIARLLGTDEADARTQLGTLAFDDPESGELVTAFEYLSGNVRQKLRVAREAAGADPAFDVNVDALAATVPVDLTPDEIHAAFGAVWIPGDVIEQFLRTTLADPRLVIEHPGGTVWTVRGDMTGLKATQEWGTERIAAPQLAQKLLEQRTVLIYDTLRDGDSTTRVLNAGATAEAQAKATQLKERFSEWVWEEPARAQSLAALYNETFNAIVSRSYAGIELSLPGKAITFQPAPHQYEAVARMIAEPAVLLAHEVGAGKTAEMAMGCMELRRLGLIRKPAIVVPNNMLEQFGREFAAIYPQAKLLIATKADVAALKRREFVSRCATGDWDAIIMTKTAFEKIPMSPQAQQDYLDREVEEIRKLQAAARARGNDESGRRLADTVKRMEKKLQTVEEKLKAKLATEKDVGLTFENTGIDYLIADEAHLFKNLRTVSEIEGASIEGSARASDLHMKIEYLREREGKRVATFATATPVANSITEVHVMQRFLRPDVLAAAQVASFDAWASVFGDQVTGLEVSPDGSRFRVKTRFAKFKNVPELVRMFHVVADIKTAEDLKLPVPLLQERPGDRTRAPNIVSVPATPQLENFISDLGARAELIERRMPRDVIKVNGESCEDNMLMVTGDGRRAALDMRLLSTSTLDEAGGLLPTIDDRDDAGQLAKFWNRHRDAVTGEIIIPRERQNDIWADYWAETYGPATTKLLAAADKIATRYEQHRDGIYPAADGTDHPVLGALQFVFSDLGTPNLKKWNVYDELRELLVNRGVPRAKIRFIHEANNDRAKGQMFEDARNGKIAVLMGSTEKMGVGTNAQRRAIALTHLDCPWRPADVQQRDGRIVRRGNLNPEIEIDRFVTEGSFDAYSWQTVARKGIPIAQVMRGRLDIRELEDVGDATLSFTEAKAIATGNPLVLKQAELQAEVTRLERLQRSHDRTQSVYDFTIRQGEVDRPGLQARVDRLAHLLDQQISTRGEKFAMTFIDLRYTNRVEAGEAVKEWLHTRLAGLRHAERDLGRIGTLGGIELAVRAHQVGNHDPEAVIDFGSPDNALVLTLPDLIRSGGAPLVVKFENAAERLPRAHQGLVDRLTTLDTEVERAHDQLGQSFPQTEELRTARGALDEVDEAMRAQAAENEKEKDHAEAPATPDEPASGEHDLTGTSPVAPAAAHTAARADRADRDAAVSLPGASSSSSPTAPPHSRRVDPGEQAFSAITDLPVVYPGHGLIHLSTEYGLLFRTSAPGFDFAVQPLFEVPDRFDGAQTLEWEKLDEITWRAQGTAGQPLGDDIVDKAQSVYWLMVERTVNSRITKIDWHVVVDAPVPDGAYRKLDLARRDGRAVVDVRMDGPWSASAVTNSATEANVIAAPVQADPSGIPAPIEPVNVDATEEATPATNGKGRRRLHFSTAHGTVLYGANGPHDGTLDVLKSIDKRDYAWPGRWKYSTRIDNGDPTIDGACYIQGTRGHPGSETILRRLVNSITALRAAGYTLDIDIDTGDFDRRGSLRLRWLDLASDPAPARAPDSTADQHRVAGVNDRADVQADGMQSLLRRLEPPTAPPVHADAPAPTLSPIAETLTYELEP